MPPGGDVVRRRLEVTGAVTGVGFRPFLFRHATRLGLSGWAANEPGGVVAEVEGTAEQVRALCGTVLESPPASARVDAVRTSELEPTGESGFRIATSRRSGPPALALGPDLGTCAECLAEVDDPTDRRHRHPFANCPACGPRYTIVAALPYDRGATTMAPFALCERCCQEYGSPADRRFHAEPIACPTCGPQLRLELPDGTAGAEGDAALALAAELLGAGGVVAVKGVGGYHLACAAADDEALRRLRTAKRRPDQPFAVLVADLEAAASLVEVDEAVADALTSPRRPIVLARRRASAPVSDRVAPGAPELGVLLPYTPLHHLLAAAVARPVVLTSGNVGGERIVHHDDEARQRLGPLTDALLAHDRRILVPCDDSVVRAGRGRLQVLRRSRGYVPEPLRLPVRAEGGILAVGAGLKVTVALARGVEVVASHHLGDLDDLASYRAFEAAIDHLRRLTGIDPEVVAHDLHPDLRSSAHALALGLPTLAVQHHHAHIASCLVEHGQAGPVVGLAFDGLGLGEDGTLWGGEVLVADLASSQRAGHLRAIPLPGGTTAIREPWRTALAWVHEALGPAAAAAAGERLDPRWPEVLSVVEGGAAPRTSAVGRLLDAVAALLGVRSTVSYEGQAAIELEALAGDLPPSRSAPVEVLERPDGAIVLDPAPLVGAVVDGVAAGADRRLLAAAAHDELARASAAAAALVATRHGIDAVALSGGCFQNRRLTDAVAAELRDHGLRPLLHREVPPNDGGISIGQAAVAAARGWSGRAGVQSGAGGGR